MLSTVTLPLIDLTLQVEFNTLTPVWSHSQTTKPRILKRHLLGIDYITYQGLVGKVDSITPNPRLKSHLVKHILFVDGELFLFGIRHPGTLVQARKASWYSQKRVIHFFRMTSTVCETNSFI